jgi:hypothetical protein
MIFLLRAFSWTSLGLVLLWSWYYLGSQSVSREYQWTTTLSGAHKSRVIFQNPEAPSIFQNASADLTTVRLDSINSQFSTSFSFRGIGQVSDKYDINGNAILPLMNQSTGAGSPVGQPDKHHWQTISAEADKDTVMFSSLSGTPVYGFSTQLGMSRWIGSYEMATSYIYSDCATPIFHDVKDFPSGLSSAWGTSFNMSSKTAPDGGPILDVWQRWTNQSIHAACQLRTYHIEVQATCDTAACVVRAIRPSQSTAFDTPANAFNDKGFSQRFFDELLVSTGIPANLNETTLVQELTGVGYAYGQWYDSSAYPSSTSLGLAFSIGMTQLINTYMSASQPQFDIYGLDNVDLLSLVKGNKTDPAWPTAKAKGSLYYPRYVLSWPWLTLDLITCGILFIAAIGSLWLRLRTDAPDIFGYVSSMTLNNPLLHVPDSGNTLSGVERARALRGVKVKLTDLDGDGDMRRIGLTPTVKDTTKSGTKRWKMG